MGYGAAVGAVAAYIAGGTAVTTTVAVTASVAVGAMYGAVIGAGMSLITGNNVLEGALKGAAMGGITGGIGEWVTGAAEAAAGAEAATNAATESAMLVDQSADIASAGLQGTEAVAPTGLLEAAMPNVSTGAPGQAAQVAVPPSAAPPASSAVSTPATAVAGKAPTAMDYMTQMQKLSGENAQALAKISSDNIKMQMLGQGVSEAGKALAAKDTNAADEQAEAQIKLRNTNLPGKVAPTKAIFTPPEKTMFAWTDSSWKDLLPYAPKTPAPLLAGRTA